MDLEFFLEEPSVDVALDNLLPRILGTRVTFRKHPFAGKDDLLSKLPARLRAYHNWLPNDWFIIVLIDVDDDNCTTLKNLLETRANEAGLVTKSSAKPGTPFQVLNRLAVEELESWFFGDIPALCTAYPRVSPTLGSQKKYRNPDVIPGGAWEALAHLLRDYYPIGLPKIEVARKISVHMDPDRNLSHSFQVFRDGLRTLTRQPHLPQ